MKTDLYGPCENCPFLREGGIRLHPARAREIAEGQVEHQGRTFACHKTTVSSDAEDGDLCEGPATQYCGGALVFQFKLGLYNQMTRIAIRLGLWDPRQVKPETVGRVFGSVLEMVHTQTERTLPRSQRPLRHTTPKRRSV